MNSPSVDPAPAPTPPNDPHSRRLPVAFAIVLGIFVIVSRFAPWGTLEFVGPDEKFYAYYVDALGKAGLSGYHQLFDEYIRFQSDPKSPLVLPPSRVTFITTCHLWQSLTGQNAVDAIRNIAAGSSVLLAFAATAFAWRAGGAKAGLAALAILSCSPLQLCLAHRALLDSFFAMFTTIALWLLWENAKARAGSTGSRLLPWAFGVSLAALVATKENSAFVYVGLIACAVGLQFLTENKLKPGLWIAFLWGPLLGCGILITAAAGIEPLVSALRWNVERSLVSPYAHLTGNGPFHRYLVDMTLINPLLIVCAIGGLFSIRITRKSDPADIVVAVFLLVTYALMSQVKLGMNLRYAAIWDLPVAWLAWRGISSIVAELPHRKSAAQSAAVLALCAVSLWMYQLIFVTGKLYDPVPIGLIQSLRMHDPAANPNPSSP